MTLSVSLSSKIVKSDLTLVKREVSKMLVYGCSHLGAVDSVKSWEWFGLLDRRGVYHPLSLYEPLQSKRENLNLKKSVRYSDTAADNKTLCISPQ